MHKRRTVNVYFNLTPNIQDITKQVALVLDNLSPNIQDLIPWCMLLADDLVLISCQINKILKSHNFATPNNSFLFRVNEESVDHLFKIAIFFHFFWSSFFNLFSIDWETLKHHLQSNPPRMAGLSLFKKRVENYLEKVTTWNWMVWKEGNRSIFEGEGCSWALLLARSETLSIEWGSNGKKTILDIEQTESCTLCSRSYPVTIIQFLHGSRTLAFSMQEKSKKAP